MTYAPPEAFPGVLYAGDGMCLAGEGPDTFTDAIGDALPFKAMVHGRRPEPGQEAALYIDDRLWALPDVLDVPREVMDAVLADLAVTIRSGGRVGLAARNGALIVQARDMLMLLVSPPEGRT
jgi:hypothetical protein